MSDRRCRRTVLASLAAGSASLLAGCNSTSSNNSDSDGSGAGTSPSNAQTTQANSESDGVIETVEMTTSTTEKSEAFGDIEKSASLNVSVADASVDAIALRNSSGEEVARKQLGTGTSTKFSLKERAADTYDILAVQDGSIVDERSKTLERAYSVEDVSLVPGNNDITFGDEQTDEPKAIKKVRTTLTNTGDLPVVFGTYHTKGDVPTPVSGEYSPVAGYEAAGDPVILPGESGTLTSEHSPMVGLAEGHTCSGEKRTGNVVFETNSGQKTTVEFEYALSGESTTVNLEDACTESKVHSWSVTSSD